MGRWLLVNATIVAVGIFYGFLFWRQAHMASAFDIDAACEHDALTPDINRDATPLVRRSPRYPNHCQRWAAAEDFDTVLVEFTITRDGRVEIVRDQLGRVLSGPRVIESSHACFNRPSVAAVSDWRYCPKIVDGEPAVRPGLVVQFSFGLNEE